MHRNEFLSSLRRALRGMRTRERERFVSDYAELIDDKRESGLSEEAAIAELGSVDAIASAILADAAEQGLMKKDRSPMTICMLALGSPVWLSLMLAVASVALALYVSVWAIIIAMCAVNLALFAPVPASVVFFFANLSEYPPLSVMALGAGFVCAALGLSLIRPITGAVRRLAASSRNMAEILAQKLKSKGSVLQ